MNMNEELSAHFGTDQAYDGELQKQAQAELFLKLAEENGIDIDQLSDEEVSELYDATFEGEGGGDADLAGAAEAEFAEKQAQAEKIAEAHMMGEQMALAYVDTLEKIAKRRSGGGEISERHAKALEERWKDLPKNTGEAPDVVGAPAGGGKQRQIGKVEGTAREVAHKGKLKAGKFFRDVGGLVSGGRLKDVTTTGQGQGQIFTKNMLKNRKRTLAGMGATAVGAAGLTGGGYATYRALKNREKKASAIDIYAGNLALEKIAEDNWDVDEAVDRLNAVIELDDGVNTKIAAANNLEEAVEIRSLELAEMAGYPVVWY